MRALSPGIGRALGSLLALAVVACGSGGAGSGAGADSGADDGGVGSGSGLESGAPCDASGITDGGRRCSLAMPVQGGLTGTLNGEAGCGDGSGTASGAALAWTSLSPGGRVSANFQGGLPRMSGTYPLSSLTLRVTGADGGAQSWTAPAGACTITVTMVDVECQEVFGRLMTIVYGTGTCNQPAAADTGNTAGPVAIGDFQFEHWL